MHEVFTCNSSNFYWGLDHLRIGGKSKMNVRSLLTASDIAYTLKMDQNIQQ